jgi:DNA-binding XRE family transcriptional regulator
MTMARFRALPERRNAMISPSQCCSARSLLGWSIAKLASAALVSATAIDNFEAERRAPVLAVAGQIRRAFERVGVVFLPGEDVRLRPGALFEASGDSARVRVCDKTRRSLAPVESAAGAAHGAHTALFRGYAWLKSQRFSKFTGT